MENIQIAIDNDKRTLRIALVQFRRNRHDPEDNRVRIDEIVSGISGVDVILLPEAWRGPKILEPDESREMLDAWGKVAAEKKIAIVTGGLFTNTANGVFDICHVIGPDGNVLAVTEKVFPSLPVGERGFVKPGNKIPVFEIAGVKVGILICVDMFYPELARSLVMRGAEVILNPANIPIARIPLWVSLLSIRSAENTAFTVFANNTMTTYPDDRQVMGGSAACGPYGGQTFDAGPEPGIHVLELNMAEVTKIRNRWPYLEDVRSIEDCAGDVVKKRKMKNTD